ncbi:MAG: alpha/beta fold hydrolase [Planctomycetaceae bacterium]
MTEQVLSFGKLSTLVGIIHDPPAGTRRVDAPAILLLNAGMVHRVGPNRLYVKLARTLAAMGYVVMRFDFSGFGDSTVREDHLPLSKSIVDETQEAMNYLASARNVEKFVLMGLCSGATASLKTAAVDSRVCGTVLINVRASGEELRTYIKGRSAVRKYWTFAAQNRGRWFAAIRERMHMRGVLNIFRAIRRDVGGAIRGGKRSFPEAEETAAEVHALMKRGVRMMVLCSEWDPGLDFMKVVLGDEQLSSGENGLLRVEIVPAADHTFTPIAKQKSMVSVISDWMISPAAANEPELCKVG